jgi:hypothetical protein
MKKLLTALTAICAAATMPVAAQVNYSSTNNTYTQNFNSLGTNTSDAWVNNSNLPGWYALGSSNAFDPPTSIVRQTGSSTGGALGNFSTTATTADRSIGWVFANAVGPVGTFASIGFGLSNTTGLSLDTFTLGYTGREWRGYSNNTPNLTVQYKLGGSFDNSLTNSLSGDANWITISALTFVLPVTNNNLQTDGLSTGFFESLTATVSGIAWDNEEVLWFRWRQENLAGTDAQMAIDDVSFSAVPEPSTYALLALAGLGLAGYAARRRQRQK